MKKRTELLTSTDFGAAQRDARVIPVQQSSTPDAIEKLHTLQRAGEVLNVPYFKMRRAAKLGLFPIYRFGNRRALVRLSEVDAAIKASRDVGHDL